MPSAHRSRDAIKVERRVRTKVNVVNNVPLFPPSVGRIDDHYSRKPPNGRVEQRSVCASVLSDLLCLIVIRQIGLIHINIVRLRINLILYRFDCLTALKQRLANPMYAVHHAAVG